MICDPLPLIMRFTQPPLTRIARSLVALLALAAAVHSGIGAEPSKEELIVPGRNIGKTYLGPDGAKSLKRLPAPTASEAGMSQNRLVWLSGKQPPIHSLFIHTTANGVMDATPAEGVTIDEIRITSPEFRTNGGIKCGSTFEQILSAFPRIRRDESTTNIYEDPAHGIAFEFEGTAGNESPCIAITVFIPNSPRYSTQRQIAELIKDHP